MKGESALVDAMLLAKCDDHVKTRSSVSDWSTIVSPRLPFTLVLLEDLQYHVPDVPAVQS